MSERLVLLVLLGIVAGLLHENRFLAAESR